MKYILVHIKNHMTFCVSYIYGTSFIMIDYERLDFLLGLLVTNFLLLNRSSSNSGKEHDDRFQT